MIISAIRDEDFIEMLVVNKQYREYFLSTNDEDEQLDLSFTLNPNLNNNNNNNNDDDDDDPVFMRKKSPNNFQSNQDLSTHFENFNWNLTATSHTDLRNSLKALRDNKLSASLPGLTTGLNLTTISTYSFDWFSGITGTPKDIHRKAILTKDFDVIGPHG